MQGIWITVQFRQPMNCLLSYTRKVILPFLISSSHSWLQVLQQRLCVQRTPQSNKGRCLCAARDKIKCQKYKRLFQLSAITLQTNVMQLKLKAVFHFHCIQFTYLCDHFTTFARPYLGEELQNQNFCDIPGEVSHIPVRQ